MSMTGPWLVCGLAPGDGSRQGVYPKDAAVQAQNGARRSAAAGLHRRRHAPRRLPSPPPRLRLRRGAALPRRQTETLLALHFEVRDSLLCLRCRSPICEACGGAAPDLDDAAVEDVW